MAKVRELNPSSSTRSMRPALSPEARQGQLISLAVDLVEKRLRDGSATSQETTHFLKLANRESELKNQLLEMQIALAQAKTEALRSEKHREELFTEAIAAMKRYSGHGGEESDEDY